MYVPRFRLWASARAPLALIAPLALMAPLSAQANTAPELAYQRVEGQNLNAFVREGPVAAHVLLRNGNDPRILVAFPAGNSGVGLWFDAISQAATWTILDAPSPVTVRDGKGRPLYGIDTVVSIDTPRLQVKQAVLSNIRFLRDYQAISKFPAEVSVAPTQSGQKLIWARDRVDGAPGYRLEIELLSGDVSDGAITARSGKPIQMRVIAVSGDTPLTGLAEGELLNDKAASDPAARHALGFLSYKEKFMAGSWRFNTYFGRDTLMSLRLLMPVLQPGAVEAGLGAVLARLNDAGEVAHEEGLSEFAILDRKANNLSGGDQATLDYGMVDDDYMLAPVAGAFLLEQAGKSEASTFLAREIPSETGEKATAAGPLLVRNFRFVIEQATPFANKPVWQNLVSIKPGRMTGEWRDSNEGLGRGVYAYNVNGVFVPAALEAADKMYKSGLLDPYLTTEDRAMLAKAGAMAQLWRAKAPGLFRVTIPATAATQQVNDYAAKLGVPAGVAQKSLNGQPLSFNALSIDAEGKAVPILNSDDGFLLLFGHPTSKDLDVAIGSAMRPFPAGLMTDVGLLVANAAQTGPEVEDRFGPGAYHGAVVWSWQQAMFAAGLERQLARKDLPAKTRTLLKNAQTKLWTAINASRATANSELWSWDYRNGRYEVVAFGAGKQDVDEFNAAQLWSTVYLAVRPPQGMK